MKTTRRAAMVAGIATMLAGTATHVNAESGDVDADLIRLAGEYAAAHATWMAEVACLDRLEEEYRKAAFNLPSRDRVIKTERDEALGLCRRSQLMPEHDLFSEEDIERLRQKPRRQRSERAVLPSDNLPADAVTLVTSVPWPEAQDRANEVVAAYDRWTADLKRLDAGNTIEAQSDRTEAAEKVERDLMRQLASIPAQSMAGVLAKVRALNAYDPISEFRTDTTEEELLVSLLTDLAQFAGLEVPLFRFCPDGFERRWENGILWFKAT